jgi:hypothetical protein
MKDLLWRLVEGVARVGIWARHPAVGILVLMIGWILLFRG